MTLLRRTVQGRLSEIFGPETLGIDELMRALDLYGYARAAVDLQTDATKAALEAYADGVNAWLRVVQAQALGRGAPEFFLFSPDIAPWTPADSIAVQKLMALQLTDKAAMETLRARLSLALPPERLRDILPDSPNAPVMGLPQFSQLFGDLPRAADRRGGGAASARSGGAAGARRRVERLRGDGAADGGRRAAARHRPAPGLERAVDLDAGADGPARGAGDGRDDPGAPGGHRRAQRRPRLGADLELSRRPGRLYREAEPRRPGRVPDAAGLRDSSRPARR